jgi:hypothetical protein
MNNCTLYIGRVWKRQKFDFSQKKLQKAELFWKHSFFAKTFVKRELFVDSWKRQKAFSFQSYLQLGSFLVLYFPEVFCNGRYYHTQWGNRCSFIIHTHMHLCMHMWREGVGTDADAVRLMQLWIYNQSSYLCIWFIIVLHKPWLQLCRSFRYRKRNIYIQRSSLFTNMTLLYCILFITEQKYMKYWEMQEIEPATFRMRYFIGKTVDQQSRLQTVLKLLTDHAFELKGESRLIRSAMINWSVGHFYELYDFDWA